MCRPISDSASSVFCHISFASFCSPRCLAARLPSFVFSSVVFLLHLLSVFLRRCAYFLPSCLFVFLPCCLFCLNSFLCFSLLMSLCSPLKSVFFSLGVFVFFLVVSVFLPCCLCLPCCPAAQLPGARMFSVVHIGARLGPCLLTASTTVSLSIELYAFEMPPCMRILLSLSFTGLLIAPTIASAPSLTLNTTCRVCSGAVMWSAGWSTAIAIRSMSPSLVLWFHQFFFFSYQWHTVSSQPEHR